MVTICSRLKFGKQITLAKNFRTNLNVYYESNTLRIPPNLDLTTGVFIDSVIYWDPKNKIPLSVTANHDWNKIKKTAILYFTESQMTMSNTGEKDSSQVRLLGKSCLFL